MGDSIGKDVIKTAETQKLSRGLALPEFEAEQVKGVAANLKMEFEAERGAGIGDFIAGDLEKSSVVHGDLFKKASSEAKPLDRRYSHLGHLQLEVDYNNNADKVKSPFGNQVGKAGIPMSQVEPGLFMYEGMIPAGTELAKGHQKQTLVMNKERLAQQFAEFGERYLTYFNALEGRKFETGITRDQAAIIGATQDIVLSYFGVPDENTDSNNIRKYEEKSRREIDEFAGESTGACTEIASLAQELITFGGEKSMLIAGVMETALPDGSGRYDNAGGGHVYLLSFLGENKDKPFIFDPMNYLIRSDDQQGQKQIQPYLVPLSEDQLGSFKKGSVAVELEGEKRMYSLT